MSLTTEEKYLEASQIRRCISCIQNEDVRLSAHLAAQASFPAHIQLIAQSTDPYKLMVCSAESLDRATAGATSLLVRFERDLWMTPIYHDKNKRA